MKRILSVFLGLALFLSILPISTFNVSALVSSGDYTYEYIDSGISITGYSGTGGHISIPADIDGNTVLSISDRAFLNCHGITSVIIPDSISEIGDEAFSGCSALMAIRFLGNAPKTGADVFKSCSSSFIVYYNEDAIGFTSQWNGYETAVYSLPSAPFLYSSSFLPTTDNVTVTITNPSQAFIVEYKLLVGPWLKYNVPIVLEDNNVVSARCTDVFGTVSDVNSIVVNTILPDTAFNYSISGFSAQITKYTGKGGSVNIPAYVGGGYPVTSIGSNAFSNCLGLTTVTIPDSVTEIGYGAFWGCANLTDVKMPDGLLTIDDTAFRNCSKLVNASIPASVSSIGYSAFEECDAISSVTIPESISSIGYNAFKGCDSLSTIAFPNKMIRIGYNAFYATPWLTACPGDFVVVGDQILINYKGTEDKVTIPGNIKSISGGAFYNQSDITDITIPEGVTYIGDSAFYGCTYLTKINIPYSVITIGDSAFQNCTWLPGMYIPTNVESIGPSAFANCKKITFLKILGALKAIGESAFYGCDSLAQVTIPGSVTMIDNYAFANCVGITSVTIGNNVTNIGQGVFSGCSNMQSISIPDSVKSIGKNAFSNCKLLKTITIPNKVTIIPQSIFSGCSGLTALNLPDTITSIEMSAFSGCTSLTSITIPNSVTSIKDNAFNNCTGLTTVTMPEGVTSIGNNAFYGCKVLSGISLPSTVKSIGESAFYGCMRLKVINIPKNITGIGKAAFSGCVGLSAALFLGSAPTMGSDVFSNCSASFVIYYYGSCTGFSNPWYGYKTICFSPQIAVSTTALTNNDVTVTITFPTIAVKKEYRIGLSDWTDYSGPIQLKNNDTVYARCTNSLSVITYDEASLTVNNIDKEAPAAPILSASTYEPTKSDVTVTITYPADAVKNEYRLNDGNWVTYSAPVILKANGRIDARCKDAAGNTSNINSININNIDREAPAAPTFSSSTYKPVNSTVTVTVIYPLDAVNPKFKIGNGTWSAYTGPIILNDNDTISAICEDAAGNSSSISSFSISNIDKDAPVVTGVADNTTYSVDTAISFNEGTATLDGDMFVSGGIVNTNGNHILAVTDQAGNVTTIHFTMRIAVTKIRLNTGNLNLIEGKSATLTCVMEPYNAYDKTVRWTSSNTDVVTVNSEGKLTAVGVGTAIITCTAQDGSGKVDTCTITVGLPVESILFIPDNLNLIIGKSAVNLPVITPVDAMDKSLTWSSSNTTVATVDASGKVTAAAAGTAVITCAANDGSGQTGFFTVHVGIPVDTIQLSPGSLKLIPGKSGTLSAVISPVNAMDKSLSWSSSDNHVATVDSNGKVTAIAVGSCVITCMANDGSGQFETCTIEVGLPVESITFVSDNLNLVMGNSAVITPTISPTNAMDKSLSWSSSDTNIAAVDANGKITAIKPGMAIITCKANDGSGVTGSFTVHVGKSIGSIIFSPDNFNWITGTSAVIIPTITPVDAMDQTLTWSSSNTRIATVDVNGKVTAIAPGSVIITCKANDGSGITGSFTVNVGRPVESIQLNLDSLKLIPGKSITLTAAVSPSNAMDKTITWSSSDTGVATVDANGKVTAIGCGKATITCSANDGSGTLKTCLVEVGLPVTLITFTSGNFNLAIGKNAVVTPIITPVNAMDKSLTWSSSNAGIATVDANGKVTAVAPGSVTITCKANDGSGITSSFTVNVFRPVDSIQLNLNSLKLIPGKSVTLTATVSPSNATDKTVTWSSSDTGVATVDANGKVTAVGCGKATITCLANDGSVTSKVCAVEVGLPVTLIAFASNNFILAIGKNTVVTPIITPVSAMDKSLTWSSSNAGIATVDANGKITAVAPGSVTITCKANDGSGITGSFTVNVFRPVNSIQLNLNSIKLIPGNSVTLTATVSPSNATDNTVNWSSSNTSVATVDANGKVTAVGCGKATITCLANDASGTSKVCAVEVGLPVNLITFSSNSFSLAIGKNIIVPPIITPANAIDKTVIWSSGNTDIATVDANGKITAIAPGSVTITCKANDGSSTTGSFTVNVFRSIDSIKLNLNSLKLIPGNSAALTAAVSPSNATDRAVIWSSSNTSVATVDTNGKVTAVGYGKATITCKAHDGGGTSKTCTVEVGKITTAIKLNTNRFNCFTGNSSKLTATVTPADAINPQLAWSSSNTKVATVDSSGKVTAVGVGTVTVTCTAMDGSNKKDTCTIIVTKAVTSIKLSANKLTLAIGKSGTLKATVNPSDAANKSLSWSSSNTAVATVDSKGKVTAKGVGKATITCTAKDGSKIKATCEITVVPAAPSGVKAVKASSTSIKLSWNKVSGATGYEIYRSTSKTGTYTKIQSFTGTSYTNTGLTKGKTYYYKIVAYKKIGSTTYKSGNSSIVYVKL